MGGKYDARDCSTLFTNCTNASWSTFYRCKPGQSVLEIVSRAYRYERKRRNIINNNVIISTTAKAVVRFVPA